MKNLLKLLILTFPLLTVQACSSPEPKKVESSNSGNVIPKEFGDRFSSETIKTEQEARYAKKRRELKRMNPTTEANKAIRAKNIYLMEVPAGRGGNRSFPGLLEPQVETVNCKTVAVEGMGDVLYGKNHTLYRQELLQYMRIFNVQMSPYCK